MPSLAEVWMATPRYNQSVTRALELLEELGEADGGELGVTELSQQLSVHPSTASRALATLARAGFVERNPANDRFRLGPRILRLASRALGQAQLRELAKPYLERLEEVSGETASLATFDGLEAITQAYVPSRHLLSVTPAVGRPAPAHCTALGKMLLALQPRSVIDQVLGGELRRYTARTISDPNRLLQELASIRDRGYAISLGERESGLVGLAAPVRDWRGDPVGAVGVSGPRQRLSALRLEEVVPNVVAVGRDLSKQIGFDPGTTPPESERREENSNGS
jgi:DNA-binding IclR family transcriptional regulator